MVEEVVGDVVLLTVVVELEVLNDVVVELEVLTDVVVDEVRRLVVGTTELVVVRETVVVTKVVLLDDVGGRVPPPASAIAAFKGSYQQLASLILPFPFGCTPSPKSVDVSNPVQQSTTVIGDAVVDFVGAHAAMAAL